ncbi:hypothetical protein F511_20767 [Dorcoceras hygrometricum]|uniref:Uncharacterized protein n=1 Tax=Dorcoceras hygrometricum TaxID=472368 RepID=A0A2Z7A6Y0_9LAMI|nr:hypothetical protein F511_20767 [Dorcoceras hygrometricum]
MLEDKLSELPSWWQLSGRQKFGILVTEVVEQVLARRPRLNPLSNLQLEEIRKLREEVSRLREKEELRAPISSSSDNLFFNRIFGCRTPPRFKIQNVGEYDGAGDLEEHFSRFENAALLHQYADPIKFQVFLTTLHNSARPNDVLAAFIQTPRVAVLPERIYNCNLLGSIPTLVGTKYDLLVTIKVQLLLAPSPTCSAPSKSNSGWDQGRHARHHRSPTLFGTKSNLLGTIKVQLLLASSPTCLVIFKLDQLFNLKSDPFGTKTCWRVTLDTIHSHLGTRGSDTLERTLLAPRTDDTPLKEHFLPRG